MVSVRLGFETLFQNTTCLVLEPIMHILISQSWVPDKSTCFGRASVSWMTFPDKSTCFGHASVPWMAFCIVHLGQAGALIRWAWYMKMVDSYISLSMVCIHFILSLSNEGTSWRKEWHVILPKLSKLISFPNCFVLVIFCFLFLAGLQLWVEWVDLLDGGFLPVCYPENFRFKTQYVEASLCLISVSLLWAGLPKKGYLVLQTWSWLYFASSIFHTQWLLMLFSIKLLMPFNPAGFTSHA